MITELLLAHNFSSQQLISHVTHIVFFSILAKKTFPVDETTFKGLKFINNVTVRQLTMTSYHRSTVTMFIFPRSTKILAGNCDFFLCYIYLAPQTSMTPLEFQQDLWFGKTRQYVDCLIMGSAILTQYASVTDGQTDRHVSTTFNMLFICIM